MQAQEDVVQQALVAAMRQEIEALEASRQALLGGLAEIESRSEAARDVLDGLERETAVAREGLAAITAEHAHEQEAVAALNREHAALCEAVDALAAERADRQARIAEVEAQFKALNEDFAVAEERLAQARQAAALAAEEYAEQDTVLGSLTGECSRRREDIAALERDWNAATDRLTEAMARLQAEREALTSVDEAVQLARHNLRELSTERAQLLGEIDQLRGEHAELRQGVVASESELAARRADNAACLADLQRMTALVAAKGAEAQAEEQRLLVLRQAGETANREREGSASAARDILHQRDLATEEADGLRRKIAALRAEAAQAQEERTRAVEDLQAQRTEFQAVYNRDRQLLNKIQREIATAQRDLGQITGLTKRNLDAT